MTPIPVPRVLVACAIAVAVTLVAATPASDGAAGSTSQPTSGDGSVSGRVASGVDGGAPTATPDDGPSASGGGPADSGVPEAPGRPRGADGVAPVVEDPPSQERGRLVIVHGGDVSLDPTYHPGLATGGPVSVWDGVRETLGGADLVAVNLECPVGAGGVPQDKSYVFRCDPAALPAMRDAGVDLVTLANNHTGDHGLDLMLDTVAAVEQAGIGAVGVGTDEAAAHAPRVFDVAGWRIAVLGFGGVVPEPDWIAYGDAPGQASGYDATRMAASVAAADEIADLVVVTVHWGAEASLTPRAEDRVKAQAMIDAGADVIFGHHAHRLQPVEQVGEASVFWNLGNLVWPRFSDDGARTALARWVVEPDGTTEACLLPVEIDPLGVPAVTGAPETCV